MWSRRLKERETRSLGQSSPHVSTSLTASCLVGVSLAPSTILGCGLEVNGAGGAAVLSAVCSSDGSSSPFRGRRLWLVGRCEAEWSAGGSDRPSACDGTVEGEDGGLSLPELQSSVVSSCVSSGPPDASRARSAGLGLCEAVICSPESRVWQRPRGRPLSRGPVSRPAEGLLTSTVSPRLNLLLSGLTWEDKIKVKWKVCPKVWISTTLMK